VTAATPVLLPSSSAFDAASYALDVTVNDRGWIVGWADVSRGNQHAVLWEPNSGAYDLGTLGGKGSHASAIGANGDVAGSAQTVAGAWHAVMRSHTHLIIVDLNTEISAKDAAEIVLQDAVGMRLNSRSEDASSGET
jgi:probable HAF family extracellular repeat protein